MKARFLSLSLALLALTSFFLSNAQTLTKAGWSTKFTSPIGWQRIHSLGYIIVSTSNGLYVVNPDDGKIKWEEKEFAALDTTWHEEIEETEFMAVARQLITESTLHM